MALSWEFKEPQEPLTSLAVTTIAGTFPAGTYDFMAVLCGPTDDLRQGAHRVSPPVYQHGVVLNGSEGVRITVGYDPTHVAGERVFTFIRVAGYAWWHWPNGGCLLQNGSYSLCYHTNPETVRDVTTYSNSRYMIHPALYATNPYGFDTQKGQGVIELTGATTNTHIANVFADMEVQGLANTDIAQWNYQNDFAGFWGIKVINGTSGIIDFSYMSLWLSGFDTGREVSDGGDYTIRAWSSNSAFTNFMLPYYGGSGCFFWLYNGSLREVTISSGNYQIGSPSGALQVDIRSGSTLKNSRIHGDYIETGRDLDTYQNCVIKCVNFLVYINEQDYLEPLTIVGIVRFAYVTYNSWFRGLKLYHVSGSIDYRMSYNSSGQEQRFLDCTFYKVDSNGDTITETDYPTDIYWRYLSNGNTQYCFVLHTIRVNVQKPDGTPFEGETVRIYDKDGVEIHTETTDADGLVEVQAKTMQISYQGTVDGYDGTVYTNLYPFTISVQKHGYAAHNETLNIVNSKITTLATLTPEPTYIEMDLQVSLEEDKIYAKV